MCAVIPVGKAAEWAAEQAYGAEQLALDELFAEDAAYEAHCEQLALDELFAEDAAYEAHCEQLALEELLAEDGI